MDLKKQLNDTHTHPPLFLRLPTTSSASSDIVPALAPCRFDVILITPNGTWDETAALPMRSISADPSFVFLWVGRGDQDGLEKGRECLAKWGFRRAEDIVWVKITHTRHSLSGKDSSTSNLEPNPPAATNQPTQNGVGRGGLLASQKEHCLMGIRGTVRRSTDTRFVHCNVDTDVMLWEDTGGTSTSSPWSQTHLLTPDPDGPHFPPYLYTLIESFCLGTRRLHLNPASASTTSPPSAPVRRGWVTASPHPPPADALPFDPAAYPMMLPPKQDGRDILPFDPEIDNLRPKSPTRANKRGGNQNPQQPPQAGIENARSGPRDANGPTRGIQSVRGNWHGTGFGARPPAVPRMGGPPSSFLQPRPPSIHAELSGMSPVTPNDPRLMTFPHGSGYPYDNDPQLAYLAAQMQQSQLGGYAWPQQQIGVYGEIDPQQQYAYYARGQVDQGAMYGYGYGYPGGHGGQGQYQYQ